MKSTILRTLFLTLTFALMMECCNTKGSETNATSGVVFFSTTVAGTGNDGNTIGHNNITISLNTNRPVNVIYSFCTAGKENSGIVICNNNT